MMEELNHTQDVTVAEEADFDTLTMINQGDAFSIAQIDEEGDLHSVIIGPEQAAVLIAQLAVFLG